MNKKYRHKPSGYCYELKNSKLICYASDDNPTDSLPAFILSNSNDWEEIKEKEYEILSFINKNNQIFSKTWQSVLYHHFYITFGFLLEEILTGKDDEYRIKNDGLRSSGYKVKDQEFKIYSVKRLSDGEIFTIGDDIENGKITEITLYTNGPIKNSQTWLGITSDMGIDLRDAKKVKKQPLFKTEDGVDIYEEDSYYPLAEDFVICNKCTYPAGHKAFKVFSTKEAAEEYVVLNKSTLSIKEVLDVFNNGTTSFKTGLEELVKQKLKK